MTARIAKTRQEPLGPDETFSALVTRLITTNRAERALRERATKRGPIVQHTENSEAEETGPLVA